VTSKAQTADFRVEVIGKDHPGLPVFFAALPKDSGWPPGTVLSLTDREPTEFERAERYIGVFEGDKLVGALSLHSTVSGNYHRQHNLHFHIDVLPAWQGRGVGAAMLSRLIELCRQEGYWRIYLGTLSWNERALSLFGGFGFRVEGISRAAYRVKTDDGDEYLIDGIGMALWIGPPLKSKPGNWKVRVGGGPAPLPGDYSFAIDGSAELDELVSLYESVGDQRFRYPEIIAGAWRHSTNSVTVRRNGELVGLARGLSDFHTTFFICDLLVRPEQQGRGLGSKLMRKLMASQGRIYQTVLLTDPGTIPFYSKLGFMHWESACLKMHRPVRPGDKIPEVD